MEGVVIGHVTLWLNLTGTNRVEWNVMQSKFQIKFAALKIS